MAWDVDFDSDLHLLHPSDGFEQYGAMSNFRFDEVGVERIVAQLERLGLKQTFFVCGWCLEQYPQVGELLAAGGHEVAHHGYMHERANTQSAAGEHQWLMRGIECIKRTVGVAPRGWRAPSHGFSKQSADLLARAGFLYDSSLSDDEDPYEIQTESGALLELPMDITMSDWPHFAHVPEFGYLMPPKAASDGMRFFEEEFEAAYETGGFLTTVWHPHVSGRRSRVRAWSGFLERLLDRGDVWLTTMESVARHCRSAADSGAWTPRRRTLPYYKETPAAVAEFSKTWRDPARAVRFLE